MAAVDTVHLRRPYNGQDSKLNRQIFVTVNCSLAQCSVDKPCNAVTVSLRHCGTECSNMRVLLYVLSVPSYETRVGCNTIILALLCDFVQLF